MAYYVCFVFMLVFLRFDSSGKTAFPVKNYMEANTTDSPETNFFVHLFRGIDWPDYSLSFPPDENSDGFITATIAIITFVLFTLPGHMSYYSTTCGILGKMYSNTMMVILNDRIVLLAQDESTMLDEHSLSLTLMSNPRISQRPSAFSIPHKRRTIPLDVYKI